jgi:transposase
VLTPGQRHDAQAFPDVLAGLPGDCQPDWAVADRAFDSDAIRDELVGRDIAPCIPSRSNRAEPVEHDRAMYRQRNRVERLVGKLKQSRRIATRYEKPGGTFMALVHLAAAFVMAR